MNNYTWLISQCEFEAETGGVITAHWRVTAYFEELSVVAYGSVNFTPDPTSDQFTPYSDLTQEQVIGWVKSTLGSEQVEAIESNLAKQLDELKQPKILTGLPWSK
jgi:hypothetical protein